ncbi:MAG: hypothetical protein ACOYT4_05615 [Nanoarchaeota archaeon]
MATSEEIEKWRIDALTNNLFNFKDSTKNRAYSDNIIFPKLAELIKNISPVKDGTFVDIYSIDGNITEKLAGIYTKTHKFGKLIGFEPISEFVYLSRGLTGISPRIPLYYMIGDFHHCIKVHNLENNSDIITALNLNYVADIVSFLNDLHRCLKPKGNAFLGFTHPDFAEKIIKKIVREQKRFFENNNFRFATEFPLIKDNGEIFYVPYFHRFMEDYKKLFCDFFNVCDEYYELKPNRKLIERSNSRKILPFYNFEGNVYYPEIIKMPSSVLFNLRSPK